MNHGIGHVIMQHIFTSLSSSLYMSADPVVDNLNPTPRANRGPAAAALVVARRGAPVRCPVSGVVVLYSRHRSERHPRKLESVIREHRQ